MVRWEDDAESQALAAEVFRLLAVVADGNGLQLRRNAYGEAASFTLPEWTRYAQGVHEQLGSRAFRSLLEKQLQPPIAAIQENFPDTNGELPPPKRVSRNKRGSFASNSQQLRQNNLLDVDSSSQVTERTSPESVAATGGSANSSQSLAGFSAAARGYAASSRN
ncbi:unnamed protein product, partial [Amoebophrya sp. A120]|eukprot:GSA120T00002543001.1